MVPGRGIHKSITEIERFRRTSAVPAEFVVESLVRQERPSAPRQRRSFTSLSQTLFQALQNKLAPCMLVAVGAVRCANISLIEEREGAIESTSGLDASRQFWDEKARENPYWYVSSAGPYEGRNLAEFWASGPKIWNDLKAASGYEPERSDTVVGSYAAWDA
jgi:hypothetical protein